MSLICNENGEVVSTWDSNPIFFGGQWFYEKNFAQKVLLGDNVWFHFGTKNISVGETVSVSIYHNIDWGIDEKLIDLKTQVLEGNYCSVNLYIKPQWLENIDKGNKKWMDLYCHLEYKGKTEELPTDSNKFLKVYAIGYLPESECLVKVRNDGVVEFWPEHFGKIATYEWNMLNFPYRHQNQVYIDANGNQHIGGVPREIDRLIISRPNEQWQPLNLNEKDNDPTYNASQQHKQPDNRSLRQQRRHPLPTPKPPTGRAPAAGSLLVLNIAMMAYDAISPHIISSEENKIREHHNIVVTDISKDLQEALMRNIFNEDFVTIDNISKLINVILYGGTSNHNDNIFQIGKRIYREVSNFRKID